MVTKGERRMNMLEISDSPFVSTSLGTQASLLAQHVKGVEFMGRQVTTGFPFNCGGTVHHPFSKDVFRALIYKEHLGLFHTFMPLNESDIGLEAHGHAVWLAHPLICNDEIPRSWRVPVGENSKSALDSPDHLLAMSHFEESMLRAAGYTHTDYMPCFIHPTFYQDPPARVKHDGFKLITVGRPSTRKNFPVLLAAVHQLAVVERLPVSLYIHGSPTDEAATGTGFDIKGMIGALGLEGIVTMPSFDQASGIPVAALRDLYIGADAYISTDLGEALGITRVEAMACGLPLVVPNHTSGPELCHDSGITCDTVRANAYFDGAPCKTPKVNDVVNAVKWLMDNPHERDVMGTNARRFVLDEFNNQRTALAWEALISLYTVNEVELK
jgi:glycosyltransferase involved in cell wall biosynthesis